MNLREQILAAPDLFRREVTIPEWGGVTVYVGTMPAGVRDRLELQLVGDKERAKENFRAQTLVECLEDASGAKIFTRKDVEDLGKKSAKVVDRLFTIASELNGMKEGSLEEVAGN